MTVCLFIPRTLRVPASYTRTAWQVLGFHLLPILRPLTITQQQQKNLLSVLKPRPSVRSPGTAPPAFPAGSRCFPEALEVQTVAHGALGAAHLAAAQLMERVVILFGVITSQEEIQEKYVVCVLFIFWNLLDMVRYTYSMLSVIGISYAVLTWLSQTLWMPIYPLCVLAEAFTIYQSLPYFESFGANCTMLPLDISTCFPYVLKLYLLVLFIGMYFTYSHLYTERKDVLGVISAKPKKK
ncbi:very-long-chain (3R)-3-hydroxyacyl-CoA dehydratase 4 isoform X2 [Peromyscus leucopus]|uniref:very-long-chain (3R)-3-hydroxyacyl-CoA dehydratase 4 isoform X2 n=1 Tax=Peromyscus leucopus TaxID=10041 RepID=UPI001884BE44|nr:very-long-chain (3R)-3-hydroxyacyl-CoA dehydratase 4 isoform X2 [Peromyscus leucopus]